MENSLELMVKLASLGTAGVSIFAIFIVGKNILALPGDAQPWKVSLMKRYQNICIAIAIICSLSGSANAYFNKEKATEASQISKLLVNQYEAQLDSIMAYRKAIESSLEELKKQPAAPTGPAQTRAWNTINRNLLKMKLKPSADLLSEGKLKPISK